MRLMSCRPVNQRPIRVMTKMHSLLNDMANLQGLKALQSIYVNVCLHFISLVSSLFSLIYYYRTYENICLLRAITSEDGMTADFYEFKKSFIQEISNKIVNSIRGINRVVYDITSKPPSTIELE